MKQGSLKVLDRDQLKLIAILAMTMDHVACGFFPGGSAIWLTFRMIGRITFPLMAYMLADGFLHTRDLKKYAVRMFWFSVVSWFTFSFLETGSFLPIRLPDGCHADYPFSWLYLPALNKTLCICRFSVLTGLLCGLLTLTVWEKAGRKLPAKLLAACGLLLVSLNCDWFWLNVFMVACFYYLRKNRPVMWAVYGILSLLYIFDFFDTTNLFAPCLVGSFRPYRLGMVFLPVLIELFASGKKGKSGAAGKWFFYVYYPAHQLLIGIVQLLSA